jgi:hypothetical protein
VWSALLLMGVMVCVLMMADAKRGLWPIVVTTLQLMGVVVCVLMVADMERGL